MSKQPSKESFAAQDEQAAMIAGRYALGRWLGVGGMGRVAEALDTRLGRRVAVKLPTTEVRRSADGLSRFLREIRLGARVDSPHVVRVLDSGFDPARGPFGVFELVDGASLGEVMAARSGLGLPEVLAIARQLARGIEAAHEAAIVHRDVKPDNVLLAWDADHVQVKLADFGLAKSYGGEASLLTITLPGTMMGSLPYMSPEQLRGQLHPDSFTDVWSFGVVLFVMLTGRSPFNVAGKEGLVDSIQHDEPLTLTDLGVRVPGWIEALTRRCFEKVPNRRPTMRAIREELDRNGAPRGLWLPRPSETTARALERSTAIEVVANRSTMRGMAVARCAG